MNTKILAEDYIRRAGRYLREAENAFSEGDFASTIRRSQECMIIDDVAPETFLLSASGEQEPSASNEVEVARGITSISPENAHAT